MSKKPFDDAFKNLTERDPEALLALLDILPPGATVTRLPREISIQALLTDQPYEITAGAERYIEHLEAQAYWQGDEDERAAGYSVRLWLRHQLPVYTYILVFSRKGDRLKSQVIPQYIGRIQLINYKIQCVTCTF